ncbi:hypothetical protein MUGA111182_17795 [Mucilaginibacter galii]|uniref:Uncharacterized protein n=1 Tax=Mucilaginibacter galii TaxID=2005073 RepID=A0A917N302_9SPHI|nr:hypothetical protein [Mucilaginibacter galii]GGI52416.1 hypothetical protein GCM10011425_36280 [Mucilaginibacter galii]
MKKNSFFGKQESAKAVDEVLSLSVKISGKLFEKSDKDTPRRSFGIGDSNVTFQGLLAYNAFSEFVEKLYHANKEISNTVSIKTLEVKLVILLRQIGKENRKCNLTDLDKLENELLALPLVSQEIIYQIAGGTCNEAQICFGSFKVYNKNLSEALLTSKY